MKGKGDNEGNGDSIDKDVDKILEELGDGVEQDVNQKEASLITKLSAAGSLGLIPRSFIKNVARIEVEDEIVNKDKNPPKTR